MAEVARLPRKLPADWDGTEVLVPDADYEVVFAGERKVRYFGSDRWVLAFQVTEGFYGGELLPLWLKVPDGRVRISHAMALAYSVATDLRAPQNLARLRPSRFLGDTAFMARTRTIKKNLHGVERPEALHYSRIDFLIKRTAGCSPIRSKSLSSLPSSSSSES